MNCNFITYLLLFFLDQPLNEPVLNTPSLTEAMDITETAPSGLNNFESLQPSSSSSCFVLSPNRRNGEEVSSVVTVVGCSPLATIHSLPEQQEEHFNSISPPLSPNTVPCETSVNSEDASIR